MTGLPLVDGLVLEDLKQVIFRLLEENVVLLEDNVALCEEVVNPEGLGGRRRAVERGSYASTDANREHSGSVGFPRRME